MAGTTILANELTRFGLRWFQVMQMGEEIDPLPIVMGLPGLAEETLKMHQRYEKDLDMHYLSMWWHPREVVANPAPNVEQGVYWWYGYAARVRDALADAAAYHFVALDQWPTHVWIQELPEGMQPGTPVKLDMGKDLDGIEVLLNEDEDLPKKIVVVGVPAVPNKEAV